MTSDQINPDHYRTDPSGIECIEITRHRNFAIGSALKYLWRAGLKTEQGKTDLEKQIEDLEKAAWYIEDEIERLGGMERIGQPGHTGKTGPTWCDLRPSIYEALQGTVAKGYKFPTTSGEETPDLNTSNPPEQTPSIVDVLTESGFWPKKEEENMNTSDTNEALRGVKEGTHELRGEHGPELIRFDYKPQTISDLQYKAHAMAKANGFWDDADRHSDEGPIFQAFIAQKLALIHSEVTEALDEVRDSRPNWISRYAEDGKPEGIASELADVVIRTLDLAEWLGIDLEAVVEEKMAYNATRPAKHGKNF